MVKSPKRLSLLVITITLGLSTVGSALLPGTTAWADPNPGAACSASGGTYSVVNGNGVCTVPTIASTFTPDQEATSYSYYVALGGCIANTMEGDFPTTVAENGNSPATEWFNTGNTHPSDAYIYPGGALTSCATIASKALPLWGWTGSTQDFLTAMGYVFNANASTGRPMYDGTSDGGTTRRVTFRLENE